MSGGGSQQSTKQEIDPRMAQLLYGNDGLYTKATTLYNQNPSGMNPTMWEGRNKQYNYLNSQGYGQMVNTLMGQGGQLVGQGAAANPFSNGQMQLRQPNMGFGGGYPQPQRPPGG